MATVGSIAALVRGIVALGALILALGASACGSCDRRPSTPDPEIDSAEQARRTSPALIIVRPGRQDYNVIFPSDNQETLLWILSNRGFPSFQTEIRTTKNGRIVIGQDRFIRWGRRVGASRIEVERGFPHEVAGQLELIDGDGESLLFHALPGALTFVRDNRAMAVPNDWLARTDAVLRFFFHSDGDISIDGRSALVVGRPESCMDASCDTVMLHLRLGDSTVETVRGPHDSRPRFVQGDRVLFQTLARDMSEACATDRARCRPDLVIVPRSNLNAEATVIREGAHGVTVAPDGQTIAFIVGESEPCVQRPRHCGSGSIYIGSIDGGPEHRIATDGPAGLDPNAFSPDGQYLAFHRTSGNEESERSEDLTICRVSTGTCASFGDAQIVAWLPAMDGEEVPRDPAPLEGGECQMDSDCALHRSMCGLGIPEAMTRDEQANRRASNDGDETTINCPRAPPCHAQFVAACENGVCQSRVHRIEIEDIGEGVCNCDRSGEVPDLRDERCGAYRLAMYEHCCCEQSGGLHCDLHRWTTNVCRLDAQCRPPEETLARYPQLALPCARE